MRTSVGNPSHEIDTTIMSLVVYPESSMRGVFIRVKFNTAKNTGNKLTAVAQQLTR